MPTSSSLASAHDLQLRRVRRMLVQGSYITAALSLSWGLYFAWQGQWFVVALDVIALSISALNVTLVRRRRLRLASYLFMAVVYALLLATALLIDIPTPTVPRSIHLFLLPLAACACLLVHEEPRWLRHGVPAACLATFVLLAGTDVHGPATFALSDAIRGPCRWIDIVASMISLHGALLVILARVAERNGIELELRNALIRGEFLLHYQPQVASDGRVLGAEALIRWKHPARGLVPPNDFIPVAESTGLMVPIGDWVLRSACLQLARWGANTATARLTMAVNVSATQFAQPDFVQRVVAIVGETGASLSLLKLELTESMLAEDLDAVVRTMSALRAHGVRFSLDDFGTGFSSLNYLRQLPLDQLKIDQSFVRNMLRSNQDASIAKTVVALGQTLGLDVIAEGVETVEHRRLLADIGCNSYQGYYFAKPLPSAEFEAFALLRNNPAPAHAGSDAARAGAPA